jgi:PKHD-type hydroxylase
VVPPLFNRYEAGMGFGAHVDNAIRQVADGRRLRTDLSCTLFLSDPGEYQGGELIIEDQFGPQSVKLAAGDLVVYPASSLHRVAPITHGTRLASFFWVQSMVRDDGQRRLLHDLDRAIIGARMDLSDDHASVVALTSTYHNLVRLWAEV